MERIRSLDGLRAISILMVIFGHAGQTIPYHIDHFLAYKLITDATLGVRIFFVISGFLITKLLLIEKEKTGDISIRNFYARRVIRIFPVFYLYILVLLLLKWFFKPNVFEDYNLILFAGLYLWNYKHLFYQSPFPNDPAFHIVGHFWSLSMEEQFYLLWPI